MTTINIPKPSESIELCPDLSALVTLTWRTRLQSSKALPTGSLLLQRDSVSSSVSIGQGTSYLITRKTVPPEERSWSTASPRYSVTTQSKHQKVVPVRHQIVYKIARVHFDDEGRPVSGQSTNLASVLLDLMVLGHEPVQSHPNIVNLLGLAWGDNGFPDSCRVPVPVIEYADLGNLADYQTRNAVPTVQKLALLHDVAAGIHFLHQCSVTHGDVKSENVLLFSNQGLGSMTAKISDFGFAVLGGLGHFNFLPRGTLLWSAPEVRNRTLRTEEVHFSDVYSFGLLFWRVMIDGLDPLCPYFLSDNHKADEQPNNSSLERFDPAILEPFLYQDFLNGQALPSVWLPKYWALRMAQARQDDNHSAHQDISPLVGAVSLDDKIQDICQKVVESTLLREPAKRNLAYVIAALGEPRSIVETEPTPDSIMNRHGYNVLLANNYTISWGALRAAPPSVSSHIMKQKLRKLFVGFPAGEKDTGNFAFGLACGSLSGMGSDRYINTKRARELLLSAAITGSTGAQAAIPRFCKTFGGTFGGLTPALTSCAQWGSLAALEDLPEIDNEAYQRAKSFLRTNMCGIGAQLFRYWNPPWNMTLLKTLSYVENYLRNTPEPPYKVELNSRGDGLLHAAASLAQFDTVVRLVRHWDIDVNQKNPQGETALHGALRSGNIAIADWLLDNGAEVATVTTYSHESPLHWLISTEPADSRRMVGMPQFKNSRNLRQFCELQVRFTDEFSNMHHLEIPSAVEDTEYWLTNVQAKRLLAHESGRKSLTVWAEPCQYASTLVSGYKDKWDNLEEGTPLHWAICRKRLDLVRILLSYGTDPQFIGSSKSNQTAFDLAAFLHEHEILKAMIDAKYPRPRFAYFDLGSNKQIIPKSNNIAAGTLPHGLSIWVRKAIEGCDGWRMVFRHGEKWKQKMEEIFKILSYELSFAELNKGVDDQGSSPLCYAAKSGYHEAVEMILSHKNGQKDINEQYGIEQWSPIFWAVHRDNKRMFYNLLDYGADVHIPVNSPSNKTLSKWTLLHVAARSIIDGDLEISTKLLDSQLPVDGAIEPIDGGPSQTPLAIAIEENQFGLANMLREKGADVNALCGYIHFQRTKLAFQCSILGCVIIGNLRFSAPRLKYLLWPTTSGREYAESQFMVVPISGFTALHVAVMGEAALENPEERDSDVANEILGLLLEKYESAEELNAQTQGNKMTALHIAVERSNSDAVKLLLEMDEIDIGIENAMELTTTALANEVLRRLWEGEERDVERTKRAEAVLQLLENH